MVVGKGWRWWFQWLYVWGDGSCGIVIVGWGRDGGYGGSWDGWNW